MSNINHDIIVVEQEHGKVFNRGYLRNIGFQFAGDSDYFCFHDVDMVPDEAEHDYSYREGATHLANKVGQFNYVMPYENYFGGVLLIAKEAFVKVNGYGNKFVGWGAEDDDLYNRCKHYNIDIQNRECKFASFEHERDTTYAGENWDYSESCRNNPSLYAEDGLNSMDGYKILKATDTKISGVDIKILQVRI